MALGLYQFFLAITSLLFACAQAFRLAEARPLPRRSLALFVASVAPVGSLHTVAAGVLLLVLIALVLVQRSRSSLLVALWGFGAALLTHAVWGASESVGIDAPPPVDLAEAVRAAIGLDALNLLMRITWYDPPTTLTYLSYALLGPFRLGGQIFTAVVALPAAWLLWRARSRASEDPSERPDRAERAGEEIPKGSRARRRALLVFLLASIVLVPWGFYIPTEVSFLNFRFIAVGVVLLGAFLPHEWVATRRARQLASAAALALVLHFTYRAQAFSADVRPALALLGEANPKGGVMMPLMFHNATEHFAKIFRLTHFLPMYFTSRHAGISSQFWAQYAERLPIAYKDGRKPNAPPDWMPGQFERTHLPSMGYVLLQSADETNSAGDRANSERARAILRSATDFVRCVDLWCLYRLGQ